MNKFIKKALFITPVLTALGSVGVYFGLSTSKDIKLNEIEKEPSETSIVAPQVDEEKSKGESSSPTHKNIPTPQNTITTNEIGFRIFPTLNQATYYKYIRIRDGKSYISDDFISHVINDVLLKMHYTDGKVYWSYEFTNPEKREEVLISFRLRPSENGILKNEIKRTYHFTLKKE